MKDFTTLITEANVEVPQFNHPDLNTPRDPNGKFWKTIEAANETSDRSTKSAYNKALKTAKDLYAQLLAMDNDPEVVRARDLVDDAIKAINKTSVDAFDAMSSADVKMIRTYLYIIAGIDNAMKSKSWFKNSHVDVKAGYIPLRGMAKDPRIKYRMLFTLDSPVSDGIVKDVRKIISNISSVHQDYVAGVEWNKEKDTFAVLLSNTPGYRR